VDISAIQLSNGNCVYLFDNFYPADILNKLTAVCENFSEDSPDWQAAEWTNKRYIFKNTQYFDSILTDFYYSMSEQMQNRLNYRMQFESATMWVDLTGMGILEPHVEGPGGGTYLMQMYLTAKTEPFNGTTIYNDDKQVLFHLPYRNNFGWMFDQATGVMHGRHSDVSPNLKRFSIMTRFV